MSGFDENIVREYFELNGFFVRQFRKSRVPTRKRRVGDDVELVVLNPAVPPGLAPTGFQLFSADMGKLRQAFVLVKGWHATRFNPTGAKEWFQAA